MKSTSAVWAVLLLILYSGLCAAQNGEQPSRQPPAAGREKPAARGAGAPPQATRQVAGESRQPLAAPDARAEDRAGDPPSVRFFCQSV